MTAQTIQLGHGGGGVLSRELIRQEILPRFGAGALKGLPDGATLPTPAAGSLVFATDSFVVRPIEFPGGNIGDLAVHGTVNDLAVCGGKPKWLSLALILEEGLPFTVLRRVLDSIQRAANACGVSVVTGDTKVVARGQCDALYINTAGIGELMDGFRLGPDLIEPGDEILVSGPLGDHGMAVMAARESIRIEQGPLSDTGPVHRLVMGIREYAPGIRFMRDPTRGGLAAVLNEMVEGGAAGMLVRECDVPFSPGAKAVAELLGLDPFHVASEGRLVLVCRAAVSDAILDVWRRFPEGRGATRIGVVSGPAGRVILVTVAGGRRFVDVPRGELLPRIC